MPGMRGSIAERYVRLARAVDRLLPGFVDAYVGPAEWEPVDGDVSALRATAEALLGDLETVGDPPRVAFLERQLRALGTGLDMAEAQTVGERIPFVDEVVGLYGVEPRVAPEAPFVAARASLDAALPGTGPLDERVRALRERLVVPPDRLVEALRHVTEHLRARAEAIVPLPAGESFTWHAVANEPWGAYNWYEGERRSRNEINLDIPWHLHELPGIAAHEGYPGHHLERITKDVAWVESGLRPECSVQLLLAPESLLSEGIAVHAEQSAFDEAELRTLLAEELAPIAGLDLDQTTLDGALAALRFEAVGFDVSANAAILRHSAGASSEEVIAYLVEYEQLTLERARKRLEFFDAPLNRGYPFTYSIGGRLVGAAVVAAGGGDEQRRRLAELLAATHGPEELAALAV